MTTQGAKLNINDQLNETNEKKLFSNLVNIYRKGFIHTSKQYVLGYHEKVLNLFEKGVKQFFCETKCFDEYDIRWMMERLLEHAQRKYVWITLSSENNTLQKTFKEPEKFVKHMWEYLYEHDSKKELIEWLEKNYQLNTRSIGICLNRYAIGEALRISCIKKDNLLFAVPKTFLMMPLFAGIAVGWLFLLQAGDAIKYFTNLLYNYTTFSILFYTFFVPLLMSWSYIYYCGEKNGVMNLHKRSLQLILLALLVSLGIGTIMIYYGFEWFKVQNDWIKDIVKDINIRDHLLKKFAIGFLFIWASMAVFIGIFAQLIWSGRGPTEIND